MSSLRQKLSRYLHEDPLFRRVLKNTGYMFSASTLSVVFVAVQSILAARLLGKSGLGLVAEVITFVTLINTLFSFRMGDYVVRYYNKAKAEGNLEAARATIKASAITEAITSLVAFAFLFLVTPLGARGLAKVYDPGYIQSLICIFSIVILANLTTETANGVLRVTNRFKSQAVISLIQSILTFTIITLAFIFKWGILEVLWGYLVGKLFIAISPTVLAVKAMRLEHGADWWKSKLSSLPPFKEMAKFTISTNLSATIKQFASESEPLLLGFFFNESAAGLYKVALAIVNLLTIPITPFIQTAFPEITNCVVTNSWGQLRKLLRKITLISMLWTIPAGLFMVIFGKWIIKVFYEIQYLPAYATLVILIVGYGIANIFFWNRSLLLAFGKANTALYVLAVSSIIKIGLAFVFLPALGIEAEAALLAFYFCFSALASVWIGYRLIHRSERQELISEVA